MRDEDGFFECESLRHLSWDAYTDEASPLSLGTGWPSEPSEPVDIFILTLFWLINWFVFYNHKHTVQCQLVQAHSFDRSSARRPLGFHTKETSGNLSQNMPSSECHGQLSSGRDVGHDIRKRKGTRCSFCIFVWFVRIINESHQRRGMSPSVLLEPHLHTDRTYNTVTPLVHLLIALFNNSAISGAITNCSFRECWYFGEFLPVVLCMYHHECS